MLVPKPKKYRDLEEWKDRFHDSPTEERIGVISALLPHNFECEFDLTDSHFVSEVIEALYSSVMNIFVDKRLRAPAAWKAISMLEDVKEDWNSMREAMSKVVMMVNECDWQRDRTIQGFLEDFIYYVDPSDDIYPIGSFVNKLYGHDRLDLLRKEPKWAGHPVVIEWLIRSLNLSGPVRTTMDWSLKDLVNFEEVGEGNIQTMEALFFHFAAAGELEQPLKEAIVKYVPLGPEKDEQWADEIS